jgi:predicted phosphodiesterase
MKLTIFSDLHLEFHRDNGAELFSTLNPDKIDVLILAGDIIMPAILLPPILKEFGKLYKNVIYLAGNHEFYKSSFPEVKDILKSIKINNVHVLDNDIVTINGQRFVGTTLWFKKQEDFNQSYKYMADFSWIKDFSNQVYKENQLAIDFLFDEITSDDVVITHHLPSYRSVNSKFIGSSLNKFFVCELDDLIQSRQPKLWIHGHTHEPCDYKIGRTRIVCNPLGYPREIKTLFDPNMTIDI